VGEERKGICEEIDAGWVAENKVVCIVSERCMCGDRRRLGHENKAVCNVSGRCM